eukprot:GHVQ01001454.1.p1 GENE.GHVQ01001454.1~~GHVQ01001454.1.p1  ORF type:complete len:357 (-),score=59.40 GHVQ01001454.1:1905-2975(-)
MSNLLWYVARLLWVGGLILAAVIALLWYFQERLLFHPGAPPGFKTPDRNPTGMKHPGEQEMEYEDVTIMTDDGVKLHAWFIHQSGALQRAAPTVIFFQGNAGNMGFRIPNFHYLYDIVRVNILAVSYRGYGWSTGFPTEQGLYTDAEAALFHLYTRNDIDQSKVFVFGRSIGGAVAIDLAAKRSPMLRGIIVENTFTNLHDMGEWVFPFFRPLRPLIRYVQRLEMNNQLKVQSIDVPFLFISGLQDTLVPPVHMRTLYELCSSKLKRLYSVQDGTHNETWHQGGAEYYQRIKQFIETSLKVVHHHHVPTTVVVSTDTTTTTASSSSSSSDQCEVFKVSSESPQLSLSSATTCLKQE